MPNRKIRAIQRANAANIKPDRFYVPTEQPRKLFRGKPRSQVRESDRRKRQIAGGQLRSANGLAV